jgi:hypothetical protein
MEPGASIGRLLGDAEGASGNLALRHFFSTPYRIGFPLN